MIRAEIEELREISFAPITRFNSGVFGFPFEVEAFTDYGFAGQHLGGRRKTF